MVSLPVAGPAATETRRAEDGAPRREIRALPTEASVLGAFLSEAFDTGRRDIRFGPIREGAADKGRFPAAPSSIRRLDRYLTMLFPGGGAVFTCAQARTRRSSPGFAPGEDPARLFRGFGRNGKQRAWGFEMDDGAGEPVFSICFPNPFIEADESLAGTPDWSRRAMWRRVAERWLWRVAEARDEQGSGFR
jgi:hypothetical protein